jgi:hypothetical protein
MKLKLSYLVIFTLTLCWNYKVAAQDMKIKNNPEYNAVLTTMLSYVEALYEADTSKIINSVHPTLRKLGYWFNPEDKKYRDNLPMTFDQLKKLSSSWNSNGKNAKPESIKEAVIYEINDRTASGKVEAVWGVDYMHLAKLDGEWKIMNIIWQSRQERE